MNREEKRKDLKNRLIDAAEVSIRSAGFKGINARQVTTEAGCALGALYNAFENLDLLIVHVNSRTLNRLSEALVATTLHSENDPLARLQALARVYVDFACENQKLWLALFEHRLPDGEDVPDWHKKEHRTLIQVILPPLRQLRPDFSDEALSLRARTDFAAVHGVVHLSLEGRFVGLPREHLHSEVAALVYSLVAGVRNTT